MTSRTYSSADDISNIPNFAMPPCATQAQIALCGMSGKAYITKLFSPLLKGEFGKFFKHVDDSAHWRVMGTHSLAGTHNNKEAFLNATLRRLNNVLKDGVLLKLVNVVIEENIAAVELQAAS